jgi:hypothetical protein
MRVLRSSLFVAVTALVAAACGDKVNVTPPAVIPPTLHGIVVAPATATITVGQTVQLTAAVSADAGVTATVSWSTTNSGVAGVTQTGLVNGAAAGTAGICAQASATGLTTVSNCAQVVVQSAITVVPAILQIASVTIAGNLNNPVPIPPAVTGGQINVSVTVNPGTEVMDSVQVNVINAAGTVIPAGTQIFTAAQAAVMSSPATDLSAQALITSLVFSINTAAFDASFVPRYLNGLYTIRVIGYGHFGTTKQVNSSTNTWSLAFFNADGWVLTQTLGVSTPGQVTNAAGFTYVGGPTSTLTVTANPVLYSGAVISTTAPLLPVVTFGTGLCGATQRSLTMTPIAGSKGFTALFPRTALGVAAVGNVNNYEFSWAACPAQNAAGGETAAITSSWYLVGNTLGPTGTIVGAANIRLDNQAPVGMGLTNVPNGRTNGWFNDLVVLNGTTANGVVSTLATDAGAGGITYAATVGGVAMTSTSTLAESSTPTAYTVSVVASDALNNATAASTRTFGVDRTPPTLAFVAFPATTLPGLNNVAAQATTAGSAQGQVQGAAITVANNTIQYSETDPGGTAGVSPSGFFSVTGLPLELSMTRVTNAATTNFCPTPVFPATDWLTVCGAWNIGTSFATPLTFSFPVAQFASSGYYVTTAQVSDQAGNPSPVLTRIFAQDLAAPIVSPFIGITPSTGTLGIGQAVTLTGNANVVPNSAAPNGLDMWGYGAQLSYGAASGGMVLWPAWNTTATFFGGTFTAAPSTFTTSASLASAFTLINSLELATPALPAAPAAGTEKPFQATFSVANTWGGYIGAPGGITASTPLAIPAATVTSVASYSLANMSSVACGTGQTWAMTAPAAAVSVQRGLTGGATATSVTLSAVLTGTISLQANSFLGGVDFYISNATGGWVYVGSATNVPSVTDAGAARTWTYSMTFTPTTVATAALPNGFAGAVRAIGRGTGNTCGLLAGSALSTQSGTGAVTIVP